MGVRGGLAILDPVTIAAATVACSRGSCFENFGIGARLGNLRCCTGFLYRTPCDPNHLIPGIVIELAIGKELAQTFRDFWLVSRIDTVSNVCIQERMSLSRTSQCLALQLLHATNNVRFTFLFLLPTMHIEKFCARNGLHRTPDLQKSQGC